MTSQGGETRLPNEAFGARLRAWVAADPELGPINVLEYAIPDRACARRERIRS